MRVVLAFDKFKGTFTAAQVCEMVAEGIRDRNPKIEVIQRPMADGGEGSAALLASNLGMEALRVEVCDLLGRPTEANIYWQNSRRLCVLESAEVLGIAKSLISEENLFKSSSLGLGKLLQKAYHLRPQEIWICIGGTLTADIGWGIASAFGLTAYDKEGKKLNPCLENMGAVHSFTQSELPEHMKKCRIVLLCDVNVPAIGPDVSLFSFLKQKGAHEASFKSIENKVLSFWKALKAFCPTVSTLEDAFTGAGGGICVAFSAVFPTLRLEMGSKSIAKSTALASSFAGAKMVVCGEGKLDELTLCGKTVSIVSQLALKNQQELVGVFGKVEGKLQDFKIKLGLTKVYVLIEDADFSDCTTHELIKVSKTKLYAIGQSIADLL